MPCLSPILRHTSAIPAVLVVLSAAFVPPQAWADGNADAVLIRAKAALRDGLAEQAEQLAGEVIAGEGFPESARDSALEIVVEARMESDPAALLADLERESLNGAPLPTDGRAALWRANALLALHRGQEAAETLQAALPEATYGPAARIRIRLPEALLAAGDTNAALAAYAALAAEQQKNKSPDLPATSYEQARLLASLGRFEEALALLGEVPPFLPDLHARTRMLRACLLDALQDPNAENLLREISRDRRDVNAPHRSHALLLLAQIENVRAATNGVATAREAAESATDPATKFAAWSIAARICAANGLVEEMNGFLREAGDTLPTAPEAVDELRLTCADVLFGENHLEEAHSLFDTIAASASAPRFESRALAGRGRCLMVKNRPDAAVVDFTRAAELAGPESRGAMLLQTAEAWSAANSPERAADAYRQAADPAAGLDEERREDAEFHYARCIAAVHPKEGADALKAFVEAHAGSPRAANALLEAARLASGDDAPAAYARAIAAIRPTGDEGLLCSALIDFARESARRFDFETSETALAEAEQLSSNRAPEAAYLRVLALYDLGREDEAIRACRAIREDAASGSWAADATLWLGTYEFNNANAQNGRFSEAARLFDEFAEHSGAADRREIPGAMLLAARALFADKRWEEAADHAARLADRFPNSEHVPAARRIQGEALQEQMRYDAAITLYDDILRNWPDTPDARTALLLKGTCLFALGIRAPARYEEAAECFRQLLPDPGQSLSEVDLAESFTTRFRLGRCLERLGKAKEAFNCFYENTDLFDEMYRNGRNGRLTPREEVLEMYSRSIFHAAELAEVENIGKGVETAISLFSRLKSSPSLPHHAKAMEELRRLKEKQPGSRP